MPAALAGGHVFLCVTTSLRSRVLTVTSLLDQIGEGSYGECQQAIGVLRATARRLERELRQSHSSEEKVFSDPWLRSRPDAQARLDDLSREHRRLGKALREFQKHLNNFNNTGNAQPLLAAGKELVRSLLAHVGREEEELLRLLASEPAPALPRRLPRRAAA